MIECMYSNAAMSQTTLGAIIAMPQFLLLSLSNEAIRGSRFAINRRADKRQREYG